METNQFKKSEITKWQRWKWMIEDMAGLYIHKIIAWTSNDPEVKELYQEMREAVMNGNQPEAIQISQEIRSRITVNTHERLN